MRFLVFALLFVIIFESSNAVGFIRSAKTEICVDGNCKDVCVFENVELSPGTEEINDGKCRKIQCNLDFSVTVKQ